MYRSEFSLWAAEWSNDLHNCLPVEWSPNLGFRLLRGHHVLPCACADFLPALQFPPTFQKICLVGWLNVNGCYAPLQLAGCLWPRVSWCSSPAHSWTQWGQVLNFMVIKELHCEQKFSVHIRPYNIWRKYRVVPVPFWPFDRKQSFFQMF